MMQEIEQAAQGVIVGYASLNKSGTDSRDRLATVAQYTMRKPSNYHRGRKKRPGKDSSSLTKKIWKKRLRAVMMPRYNSDDR